MGNHVHKIQVHDYNTSLNSAKMTDGDVEEHLYGYCVGTNQAIRNDSDPQITLQVVDKQQNVLGAVNLDLTKERRR